MAWPPSNRAVGYIVTNTDWNDVAGALALWGGNVDAGAYNLTNVTQVSVKGATSGSTAIAASATASGTLTLPAATDTLVGKATTDTFTNKTFDTAGTGNVFRINGTAISAVTGSGSVVLATSPTLVTPALGTPTSGTLSSCTGLPISTGVSGLGAGVATALAVNTGTAGAFVVNGGALGTPSSGTLTSCTSLPISTGVSGLGTGIATFLATPTSANLLSAMTTETGTGLLVFATSPTLTTPDIGAATGTSLAATGGSVTVRAAATQDAVILTGRAGGTGSFGVTLTPTTLTASRTVTLADGNTTLQAGTMAVTGSTLAQFAATTSAQLAGVISDETGSGSLVFATSPTLVTPILGTPTSGTLSNCTGLPISTGVSGLGTGVATFLATPSSSNLLSAMTDETGTGSLVFGTSPTLTTPTISSGTLTGSLTAGGATGTSGQFLQSTGTGVQWASSGGVPSVLTKTANYTVATGDGANVIVRTDCTAGTVTITLYTAVGNTGDIVTVKKIDSSTNAVTIATTSSQTIDGATTYSISSRYNSITVISNGTNWDVI